MPSKKSRILLVDDHDVVLRGLKQIIKDTMPEVLPPDTVSTGTEALNHIKMQHYDLCVLDMELPDIAGLELIKIIRETDPNVKIVVNTIHDELWYLKALVKSDVDGILFKSVNSAEIETALRTVLTRGSYFCESARQAQAMFLNRDNSAMDSIVTPRELEVLMLIAGGKNTQEIAQALDLSANTIETHRRHLLEKFNARNVAELIITAVSRGIIPIKK